MKLVKKLQHLNLPAQVVGAVFIQAKQRLRRLFAQPGQQRFPSG